ncbi:MAG: ABC transporter substrate-binding protein [Desulfobacteraceae bacterium]|nr:ABC transporter substrate-binding protein [Desulfobacteraceae bacterium]
MNLEKNIKLRHIKIFIFLILFSLSYFISVYAKEPGISDNLILLGQSCALSGPSEDLGKGMRTGLISAFEQSNINGGVNGRQVRLLSKDDYYEPGQAIKNTNDLIFTHDVFALIGEVGTPTSRVVVPIVEEANVPFIAPFTGARFLRTPFKKQVINIRAGYDEETQKLVTYLIEKKRFNKIACFYQNDSFGVAGLNGVKSALKKYGMELVALETYQRNTVAVMGGFLRIRKADPEAIIIVGSYQPCAEFIKLGKSKGMKDVTYCSLSFVGSNALKRTLRNSTENVIISQVFPSPFNKNLDVVNNYFDAMEKFHPEQELSYITFEGYIAGRFFIEVIKGIDKNLTRKKFIQHIEQTKTFNIGGIKLEFGSKDHQGLDDTYLTEIKNNKIVSLSEIQTE